jgi:hypothetical protein
MQVPKDSEKLSTFLHRHMVAAEPKRPLPTAKQRIAAAEGEYRARKKGK